MLVSAPEAWAPEQRKIKRPAEWIVSALRASDSRSVGEDDAGVAGGRGVSAAQPMRCPGTLEAAR